MAIFVQIFINIITYKKRFQKNLTFGPRQGYRLVLRAIHLHLCERQIIFFPFNQWCLFIKWKVEARTTLFMQSYLFYITPTAEMRFYARVACGNPHFHMSWYKISYNTRAKKPFFDKCDYITRLQLVLRPHTRQKTFHRTRSVMYEVWLLNNETGYEKGFYYKNYFTLECSPSIYSPSLATHLSIRFFHWSK